MKKITAIALISIALTSCKKETKTVTQVDPETGKTVTVEVPVTDSTAQGSSTTADNIAATPAIVENNGVYTQSFKLEKGKTYPLKTVTKESQTLTDPNGKKVSGSTYSMDDMTFTVNDFNNGVYDITINLIGKKTSQTVNGKTVSVDTSQPAPKDESQKMIWTVNKALSGNQLNLKMNENGNIQSVTGFDAIYNKVNSSVGSVIKKAEDKKGFIDSFKQSFNEKVIKEQFNKNIQILPAKGAKIGEKWSTSQNASPDGKVKFTTNYVLKSIDNGVATIEVSGGIPTQSDKESKDGMTHSISSGVTQSGTIKLDTNTGWIISHAMNVKSTQKESISDGKKTQSMTSVSNTEINVN